MNNWEITFEDEAWQQELQAFQEGEKVSALHLLALMEREEDEVFSDGLKQLRDKGVELDLSDLPKYIPEGAAALRLREEEQLVLAGKLETGLDENDPLRVYLQEIAMPASGEDAEIMALLPGVIQAAKESVGRGVLLMDLIQEGSLGLWEAIQNGQESRCDWYVRQTIAGAVLQQARTSGLGNRLRLAAEDYRSVEEKLLAELGRGPSLEEMAEQLHMSAVETEAVQKFLEGARMLAQVKAVPDAEEPDEEEELAVEDTAYFRQRQRIAELLEVLNPQERKLLALRFGLEGGVPMSPEDAGKALNLTAQEASTMEAGILARLRNT